MLKKFFMCLLVLLAFSCDSNASNGKIEVDFNFNRGNNNQQSTKASPNAGKNTKKPQRKETTNAIKIYRYNIPSYIDSARYGNVESKTILGLLYASGWNVEQDYEKAAYWLEDATIYRNVDDKHSAEKAMNYLALLYIEGLGVPKNIEKAKELLANASDYGSDYGKEFFPEYCRNYELIQNGRASEIKKYYPEIVSPSGVVTGDNVNIRSGPGTSYRSLGRLDKGVNANVIETVTQLDGVWCHVIFPGGLSEGWIFGKYLQPNKAPTKIALNLFGLKIDEKNFPDPYFRSSIRSKFDIDMDGILNDEEEAKITEYSITAGYYINDKLITSNIKSLKGIEYLKHLKKLDLHKASVIGDLDLSYNTALEEVQIYNEYNQPVISTLSIKDAPNLKRISCALSNLPQIDYKKYPKLEYIKLDCSRSHGQVKFIPVDFSENKVLKDVYIYQEEVNRMQVEEKDGLFCVDLGKHVQIENIKNIIFESLDKDNPNIAKYNKETGEVFFTEKPSALMFYYQTHSPQNYAMRVKMKPYIYFRDFEELCKKDSPEELIAELKYRGLDANYVMDFSKGLPLICSAASHASTKIIKTLIDFGADINVRDFDGDTPLADAVSNPEAVKIFLDMNADVNSPNNWGRTPLMKAAEFNSIDTIKMLIEHGAYVNSKDQNGSTVFMHIDPYGDPQSNLQTLQVLIDAGADVNAKDNNGRTVLMHFMPDEYTEDCYIVPLIKAGSDVNAQNNDGETVLGIATRDLLYYFDSDYYLKHLITDLIKAGARGDIRDKSGYCPIEDEKYGKDIRALIKKYQKK